MTDICGTTFNRARSVLLGLPLAAALFFAAPEARATAAFDGAAFASITITGVTNLTTAGDLSGLLIEGGAATDCECGDALILAGAGVGTESAIISPELLPPDFDFFVLGAGDAVTMDLTGSGSASATGFADLIRLTTGVIFFTNDTSTETYSIDLELSYSLDTSASVDDPSTEDAFAYAEIFAGTFFGPDFVEDFSEADPLFGSVTGPASDTLLFTLVIAPEDFDAFAVDLALEGLAEVIPAPGAVPLMLGAVVLLAWGRRRA